jgi:Homing endonuclease associated repeat/HNH endonuclease
MSQSRYKLERVTGQPVSDEDLLNDLRATAEATGKNTIGMLSYREKGKYDDTTISRRFGSWNKALVAADLKIANSSDLTDERLFENILVLWQHYGRQPRRSELAGKLSSISQSPYNRRFGSWTAALEAFVVYANDAELDAPQEISTEPSRRTTSRDPSLRLRWRVLQRDRFTCCSCGASPALTPGVELHVDHILAWSKGGETVFHNLQTLCSPCNLGKSNV